MKNSGFFMVFIALSIIWCFLLYTYIRNRFKGSSRKWVEVTARVVFVDEKISRGQRGGHITMYQPTFEYEWRGFTRTLRMDAWDSSAHYQVGDEVQLLIDPEDASHYRYKNILQEPAAKMLIGFFIMVAIILASNLLKHV